MGRKKLDDPELRGPERDQGLTAMIAIGCLIPFVMLAAGAGLGSYFGDVHGGYLGAGAGFGAGVIAAVVGMIILNRARQGE